MRQLFALLIILTFLSSTYKLVDEEHVNTHETIITNKLPKAKKKAFIRGEKLDYKLAYGLLGGGTASIEVEKKIRKIGNRNLYHIIGTGRSTSFWDNFYKVRDRYETFVEEETFYPRLFLRNVDEGGYQFQQDYKFYPQKQLVKTQDQKEFEVPTNIQDMVSAFFYARTFDFSSITKGDIVTVETFVDDEIFPLSIKYLGNDKIKVQGGEFDCMKFAPIVQKGRIFNTEDDLSVWISNDANKIPVKAEAQILIGSVTMELTNYMNLAN